jgi:limonene 1,2-monooxygenase
MEFGIFSNGFRPHANPADNYNEDIREIVHADELGFRDAYISEHHGEKPYIRAVDTIPMPEMMMCKAAALTKRIRMGAAVKLIHLHHPIDVAIEAAIADHMLGPGRYIFGFGTGFASPLFSEERGLSFEDRGERQAESLEAIIKCWNSDEPFDLEGRYWQGKGIIALPKPHDPAKMLMATATSSEPMQAIAAQRGYIELSAFIEPPARIRAKTERYIKFATAAGHPPSVDNITVSRLVYIAETREQAIEDLRAAVAYEVSIQAQRGFLSMLKRNYGIEVPNDERAIDFLADTGLYIVGTADEVTEQLTAFYNATGGFGTLLIVAGKAWATRAKREHSMQRFMSEVAPKLRKLSPAVIGETVTA